MLEQVLELRKQRLSLREIGKRVGMSSMTVRRLLNEHGITNHPANRYLSEERAKLIYGCSPEEVKAIQNGKKLSEKGAPALIFTLQKKKYKNSPGWTFTLPTWWALWKDHWARRSIDRLVFLPIDDTKPVGPGNARITNRSELSKLGHRSRGRSRPN